MATSAVGTVVAKVLVTMRLHSALLSCLVLVTISTAACSVKLGDQTAGEKGNLTFAYEGPRCFLGCGLDRSALQGSLVTVNASGGDPTVRAAARIAESSIAHVSEQTESCTCSVSQGNQTSGHSVPPSSACAAGETKTCTLAVDIETTDQGDARLEVVDPKGAVIDSVVVHVRPAARIDITVSGATKSGDVYETHTGTKVKLESHAFGADGAEVLFKQHGISHDYGDMSIMASDPTVLIGTTDVEDMIAKAAGNTTVKVHAPGAEQLVRFHVVP